MLDDEEQPVSVTGQQGQQGQQMLLGVHNHLRQELERLRQVVRDVVQGTTSAADARSHLNQMSMRQNYWTLGAFCAVYCRVVSVHHAIEDQRMLPDLRRADDSLGPVLDRLADVLLAHLSDEEDQLLGPIGRLGINI